MRKCILISSFALSAWLLFGQLEPNSMTVTASQGMNVQPDQALFAVYVTTGLTASLNDVLAAVKGAASPALTFQGGTSAAAAQIMLGWKSTAAY